MGLISNKYTFFNVIFVCLLNFVTFHSIFSLHATETVNFQEIETLFAKFIGDLFS
jgi:hypothetical protein